jgi:hypothetical protein
MCAPWLKTELDRFFSAKTSRSSAPMPYGPRRRKHGLSTCSHPRRRASSLVQHIYSSPLCLSRSCELTLAASSAPLSSLQISGALYACSVNENSVPLLFKNSVPSTSFRFTKAPTLVPVVEPAAAQWQRALSMKEGMRED